MARNASTSATKHCLNVSFCELPICWSWRLSSCNSMLVNIQGHICYTLMKNDQNTVYHYPAAAVKDWNGSLQNRCFLPRHTVFKLFCGQQVVDFKADPCTSAAIKPWHPMWIKVMRHYIAIWCVSISCKNKQLVWDYETQILGLFEYISALWLPCWSHAFYCEQ